MYDKIHSLSYIITQYFNSYCKLNWIPLSATLLYLKSVLYWPEDDRLRSKHVAIMWPDCIYYITVMIYCCVLTVYNTLYTFVNTQLSKKKNKQVQSTTVLLKM